MDASQSWIPGDGNKYMDYAKGDGGFAQWLELVDMYSQRFLSMEFFEFEHLFDPLSEYCESQSPLSFVRHLLVPSLVCDFGCDFVEELIVDQVLWGSCRPPDR